MTSLGCSGMTCYNPPVCKGDSIRWCEMSPCHLATQTLARTPLAHASHSSEHGALLGDGSAAYGNPRRVGRDLRARSGRVPFNDMTNSSSIVLPNKSARRSKLSRFSASMCTITQRVLHHDSEFSYAARTTGCENGFASMSRITPMVVTRCPSISYAMYPTPCVSSTSPRTNRYR